MGVRLCERGCGRPSIEPRGSRRDGKLCAEHLEQRRARRAASHAQPKCRCGACRPLYADLCRRCADEAEQLQREAAEQRRAEERLARIEDRLMRYELYPWTALAFTRRFYR